MLAQPNCLDHKGSAWVGANALLQDVTLCIVLVAGVWSAMFPPSPRNVHLARHTLFDRTFPPRRPQVVCTASKVSVCEEAF